MSNIKITYVPGGVNMVAYGYDNKIAAACRIRQATIKIMEKKYANKTFEIEYNIDGNKTRELIDLYNLRLEKERKLASNDI